MSGDRRALASLICGLASLVLPLSILGALSLSRQTLATTSDWVYGGIAGGSLAAAVAAVIFGHLAGRASRRGMAVTGLLLGYGTLVIPVLFLTAALAGRLANTPARSNESIATGLVPILQISLEEYRGAHGEYPATLTVLAATTSIDPGLLTSGHNNGYFYRYERTAEGYRLRADPEEPGKTGRRRFDVTQSHKP